MKPTKFRLKPTSDEFNYDPIVSDLGSTIGLIDSILGFDEFDLMSEMLDSMSMITTVATAVEIDVDQAGDLFELRRLLIERYNEYVVEFNKDPDTWIRRLTERYNKGQELINKLNPKMNGSRYR